MADILIRGMKMPKVCIDDNEWYGSCPMDRALCAQLFAPKEATNGSLHNDRKNQLPLWCPLIPVAEGHGRLVDAERLRVILCRLLDRQDDEALRHMIRWIIQILDKMDTIVPAENDT